MKRQKTPSFWAMLKNSFFWRFLHENGMKWNPIHAAETHSSNHNCIAVNIIIIVIAVVFIVVVIIIMILSSSVREFVI